MGGQGHDDHHGLCLCAQQIEDGTFAGSEGFVTRVTDEPLFLLRMDTDIALARLASGRTVPIGAECGCGVHDGPPGVVWKHAKRSIFGPPFSLQVRFTTVKCRATRACIPLFLPEKLLKAVPFGSGKAWQLRPGLRAGAVVRPRHTGGRHAHRAVATGCRSLGSAWPTVSRSGRRIASALRSHGGNHGTLA